LARSGPGLFVWDHARRHHQGNQGPEHAGRRLRRRRTAVSGQAFQSTLVFEGRLKQPAEFGNIVVKSAGEGRLVRLKDIARVDLMAHLKLDAEALSTLPAQKRPIVPGFRSRAAPCHLLMTVR
jgi:hypothetical protein